MEKVISTIFDIMILLGIIFIGAKTIAIIVDIVLNKKIYIIIAMVIGIITMLKLVSESR